MSISTSVLSNLPAPLSADSSVGLPFGSPLGLLDVGAEFSAVFAETAAVANLQVSPQVETATPILLPFVSFSPSAGPFSHSSELAAVALPDDSPQVEGQVALSAEIPVTPASLPLFFDPAVYQANIASSQRGTVEIEHPAVDASAPVACAVCADVSVAASAEPVSVEVAGDPPNRVVAPALAPPVAEISVGAHSSDVVDVAPISTPTNVQAEAGVMRGSEFRLSMPLHSALESGETATVSIPFRFSAEASSMQNAAVNARTDLEVPIAATEAAVASDIEVTVEEGGDGGSESDDVDRDLAVAADTPAVASLVPDLVSQTAFALGLGLAFAPVVAVVDPAPIFTPSATLEAGSHSALESTDLAVATRLSAGSSVDVAIPSQGLVSGKSGPETTAAGVATAALGIAAIVPAPGVKVSSSASTEPMLSSSLASPLPSAAAQSLPNAPATPVAIQPVPSARGFEAVSHASVEASAVASSASVDVPKAAVAAAVISPDVTDKNSLRVATSVEARAAASQAASGETVATATEKFAGDTVLRRTGRGLERGSVANLNKKGGLLVADELLAKQAVSVGTEAANPVAAMVHDIRQTRFAAMTGEGLTPAGGVRPIFGEFAQTADVSLTTSASVSAAVQAVQKVTDAADVLVSTHRTGMTLKLQLDDVGVAVNVEYRNGEVRATFHTDSTELRQALSAAWQTHASAVSEQKPYRFAEPVYASSSTASQAAGSSTSQEFSMGGDTSRQFSQSPQSESAQASFASNSRIRTSSASSAPTVSSHPVVATEGSLRLHAFA